MSVGIVAIALNESSLGTAGVATNPGANMFGFGAYDSNPEYANNLMMRLRLSD